MFYRRDIRQMMMKHAHTRTLTMIFSPTWQWSACCWSDRRRLTLKMRIKGQLVSVMVSYDSSLFRILP